MSHLHAFAFRSCVHSAFWWPSVFFNASDPARCWLKTSKLCLGFVQVSSGWLPLIPGELDYVSDPLNLYRDLFLSKRLFGFSCSHHIPQMGEDLYTWPILENKDHVSIRVRHVIWGWPVQLSTISYSTEFSMVVFVGVLCFALPILLGGLLLEFFFSFLEKKKIQQTHAPRIYLRHSTLRMTVFHLKMPR